MSKFAQMSLLAVAVALTTASTPFVPPVQPVMTLVPVAIIEGGTVSTLPKSVKVRAGKVVVLRGRSGKAVAKAKAKKPATPVVAARAREKVAVREAMVASGGSSLPEVPEMRNSESGLRVMIIGPDGLTRTRYIPAAPPLAARAHDD